LQNFSTINISKNKNAIINLSQYFADPDGDKLTYSYYKADNITVLFDDDTATFLSGKNVAGIRFTYITADDSENTAVSNVFMINVSEEMFKPKVEIGKPVKWKSMILINDSLSFNFTLPKTSSNITLKLLNDTEQKGLPNDKIKVNEYGKIKNLDIFEFEKKLENVQRKISVFEEAKLKDALKVTIDDGEFTKDGFESKLNELYSKKSEIEAQSDYLSSNLITALITANPILFINESLSKDTEVEIDYETEAPIAIENEINANTKQIKIVTETITKMFLVTLL
jgi:hypothetical protein